MSWKRKNAKLAKEGHRDLLRIGKSEIAGRGLFWEGDFVLKRHDFIGWALCKPHPSGREGAYTLHAYTEDLTDMVPVKMICEFRFMNHNPQPTAALCDDCSVIAMKRIKPGDEITIDYSGGKDPWGHEYSKHFLKLKKKKRRS